ncbi:MAG TPA: hypothetical protein VIL85_25830 [Thermomicrobiales bacterium]|jgi:hypothetical protein
MAADPLSGLLRVAEGELARLFAPLLASTSRFLRGIRGALALGIRGRRCTEGGGW